MFDQQFFNINRTPKNITKSFSASYSNIGFFYWRRWKMVANCCLLQPCLPFNLPWICSSVVIWFLQAKMGLFWRCWHHLSIYHFPTLTPSCGMFSKIFVFPTCFSKLSSFGVNKKSLFRTIKQAEHFTWIAIHHCYPSAFQPMGIELFTYHDICS